ncbi:MAG: nucleotidyltransferase family protein [Pseudomonadota bacterium]
MGANRSVREVSLLVLAAGHSTRFGSQDKLAAPFRSSTVLEETLKTYETQEFQSRTLVIPTGSPHLEAIAVNHAFKIVFNPHPEQGLSSSIQYGLADATLSDGVMIALGDMPSIRPETISRLVEAFGRGDQTIFAPTIDGRRGHPIIFAAEHYDDLRHLSGDQGGRSIIENNAEGTQLIEVDDPGILADIDTEADRRKLNVGRQ